MSDEQVIISAEDRPVRLPRDNGNVWATTGLVIAAAAAAAGAITLAMPRAPEEARKEAVKPPEQTPGVQAVAPAPRVQKPETPPEPPKVQERVGGGEAPPPAPVSGAPQPPRIAPFQVTPEAPGTGPRQIPLTPRPVQTTPVVGKPPLTETPAASNDPPSPPTEAPLPRARPKG